MNTSLMGWALRIALGLTVCAGGWFIYSDYCSITVVSLVDVPATIRVNARDAHGIPAGRLIAVTEGGDQMEIDESAVRQIIYAGPFCTNHIRVTFNRMTWRRRNGAVASVRNRLVSARKE